MVKIISYIYVLAIIMGLVICDDVKYTIPLGYYSNRNLPFGIETDVHIDELLTMKTP